MQSLPPNPAFPKTSLSLTGVGKQQLETSELSSLATQVRRDIVTMTSLASSGHPGGSLSAVEILLALYFHILRVDPTYPGWPDRDRFIQSKAHACPVLYSALARRGFFPVEELGTFRKVNSRLQGHAHAGTPGVDMSGGSLGQGLSFGIGAAIAGRLDNRDYRVHVLLGDGELEEGQIWEAAMAAPFFRLDNLVAIVDRNRIQNDRFTDQVMGLEPLNDRWEAFGWHVLEVNGHNFLEILEAFSQATKIKEQPTVIIAHTIKGKGVSFMENNPEFHGKAANSQQLEQALLELALEN